ncbi:MAG: carboxylate-amine ligase [Gammaproteobacteria bacterium]|nr:MAG: carboxylate-amine ligase [Gammaproteobacteria bacterium]
MIKKPEFTLGIEEEYLLIDADSRALIVETPKGFLDACKAELGDQVSPEFLQCQVEIGTRICRTAAEAKSELMHLRRVIIDTAKAFDMQVIAASTHPFSHAEESKHTPKTRYQQLALDLQAVVRHLQISGMHVHCGLGDNDDLRIDFMEQVAYILPHLLALTTSSPFWGGENTGLKSYRLAIWDQMPRTGLPGHFESYGEYQRYVNVLVKTGVIEDATKIWWDIRPSDRYPTLEMRISDICTRVEDAVCIAAIYQCWLHMLWRLKKDNMKWRRYSRMLINENRWRAQRYGIDQGLIDFGEQCIESFPDLIEEMQGVLLEDAQLLDCVDEVQHARTILANGTSAHRQVAVYQQALASGKNKEAALVDVVDSLIRDTQYGMDV